MIGSIERKEDSTMFTLINPEYVEELEKENKELNEHLDSVKDFYETELENKYKSILTELEEWLKEEIKNYKEDLCDENYLLLCNKCEYILDKIQELKEKYK